MSVVRISSAIKTVRTFRRASGEQNGAFRHGGFTQRAVAERRAVAALFREVRKTLTAV
jgi:hypothetical protein